MNVEFLVHGTLTGQAYWKEADKDYCSRAYTPRPENVVLEAEIVKQSDGSLCSYYNYLRYNNIVSSRTGAYFGMTVRVDGMICCDVENMFHLFDTLFNKCVVGTLFKVVNNTFVYTCDSFQAKDSELKDIERKFASMFSALFVASNDFAAIPSAYQRKTGLLNIHNDDVNKTIVRDTLLAGNKLCVSPFFPTKQSQNAQSQILAIQSEAAKQVKAAKEECARQIQTKELEMEQASKDASSDKAQLKKKVDDLKKQLEDKENELETVKADYRKQELNAQINQAAKDLKEPIMKMAAIMAARFPEDDSLDNSARHKHHKEHGHKDKSSFVAAHWKAIGTAAVLLVLVGVAAWPAMSLVDSLKEKDAMIKLLNDSIAKIQDPVSEVASDVADNGQAVSMDTEQELFADTEAIVQPLYDLANLQIDIVEKNKRDAGLKYGKQYTFRITGGDYPNHGKWVVNEIVQSSDKYYVIEEVGTDLSIEYVTPDGQKVGPRTIKVIQ